MLLVYVQKKERESAHAQSSGRIFQTAKKKEEKNTDYYQEFTCISQKTS
jgi:hypothetical protein